MDTTIASRVALVTGAVSGIGPTCALGLLRDVWSFALVGRRTDKLEVTVAFRAFAGIDLGREPVPDATTILKFRHLLERHDLGRAIFAEVGLILQQRGLKLSAGTKSRTRARVEHAFLVLKRLWGFAKVRYRGLAKNANRAYTALAMVNLYMVARRVPALVRP